jgi:hypothetical protein
MKIATLLSLFLSIPLLAFAASQNPETFSLSKIIGELSAKMLLILLGASVLRFGAKRVLKPFHFRQYSYIKEIVLKIIRYHNHFALSALVIAAIHGVAATIPRTFWSTQMLIGILTLFLFLLTAYFGFLLNQSGSKRHLFYTLHMTTLVLAISSGVIHMQYRLFFRLFH